MKVLAACGSGMGSSQIIKMKLTNVFRKLNIPLEVHHCAVSEAKSSAKNYDLVVISSALLEVFDGFNVVILNLEAATVNSCPFTLTK